MINIPYKLQFPEFRFIKIGVNNKIPLEKDWGNTKNYVFNDPIILDHINKGANYGVCGGYGGLAGIDADSYIIQQAIEKDLPETFTVKSGGISDDLKHPNKLHYYYKIVGDLEKTRVLLDKNSNNIGHVRWKGGQLVGPTCMHETGNKYEIIKDIAITTIDVSQLLAVLAPFMKKRDVIKQDATLDKYSDDLDLPITNVVSTANLTRKATGEYQGSHPFHHSSTKWDFEMSTLNNCWRCYAHYSAGNVFHLIAIEAGILKCEDVCAGCLKGQDFLDVLKIAKEKYGLIVPKSQPKPNINEATDLRNKILTLLLLKKKREASETLVDEIKGNYKIYTIRDDEFTEMWVYSNGIYIPQAKTVIKEFCRNVLGEAYTTNICNEVIDKISADTFIDEKDFFDVTNIDEIAVQNGILNIHTRKLNEFTKEKIFFSKLPITYDHLKKCPNIETHFDTVLKNPKTDKPILKELFGFLILKEYKIEKAFMFCGTGRNGKGKTLELMKRFLGVENCANIPLQQFETDNFSIGELFKKMANLGGDIDNKALYNTGHFKQLTGRDLISAARKFKTRVHFVNYAKLIFCANELPITYDQTPAFFNRWILLDFPFTFVSQKELDNLEDKTDHKLADPSIVDSLATPNELSGLLNCALDALKNLIKQGDFSYSETAEGVKTMWLRKSSSLNGFILDCLKEDWNGTITKKEFRKAYAIYCRANKLRSASDKVIKNVLAEHGVSDEYINPYPNDDDTKNRVWCWTGFSFNEKG